MVLPVYNGADKIEAALAGLFAQTMRPFKVLIIDDGSTDDTGRVIAQALAEQPDLVKDGIDVEVVVHDQNMGLVASLNEALARCTTPYIARADHDDVSSPDRLMRQYTFMQTHRTTMALVGCGVHTTQSFDAPPCFLSPWLTVSHLFNDVGVSGHGMMGRTDVLKRLGGFGCLESVVEDYLLSLKLSRFAGTFDMAGLPEPMVVYDVPGQGCHRDANAPIYPTLPLLRILVEALLGDEVVCDQTLLYVADYRQQCSFRALPADVQRAWLPAYEPAKDRYWATSVKGCRLLLLLHHAFCRLVEGYQPIRAAVDTRELDMQFARKLRHVCCQTHWLHRAAVTLYAMLIAPSLMVTKLGTASSGFKPMAWGNDCQGFGIGVIDTV
ncbi:MAG: glycosyltransferase family 2 protein [Cyanobacteria bacterium HKST-UBA03]|nr:glycosyltransferase family 2 protein [Cyanobacteria bacterium HKST-UBA03]